VSESVEIPQALSVTEAAAAKVKQLVSEEDNAALNLRVYVTGGGCAGFSYGFRFDDNVNDSDTVIEKDGVKFVIDSISFPYLAGSQVDYSEGLQGSQFVVKNPNATTTCGCGSSFSI
jgi:iron-sulfur cluster insertion protein